MSLLKSFLGFPCLLLSSMFARDSEEVLLLAMVWWADEVRPYSSANSTLSGPLLLLLICISTSLFALSLCLIRSSLAGSHRSTGAIDLISFSVKFLAKATLAFGPLRLRMDSTPSSTIGGAFFLFQDLVRPLLSASSRALASLRVSCSSFVLLGAFLERRLGGSVRWTGQ